MSMFGPCFGTAASAVRDAPQPPLASCSLYRYHRTSDIARPLLDLYHHHPSTQSPPERRVRLSGCRAIRPMQRGDTEKTTYGAPGPSSILRTGPDPPYPNGVAGSESRRRQPEPPASLSLIPSITSLQHLSSCRIIAHTRSRLQDIHTLFLAGVHRARGRRPNISRRHPQSHMLSSGHQQR